MTDDTEFPARPAWQRGALCRGMGPRLFFPPKGGDYEAPRRLCAECPVREECLEQAMAFPAEKFGLWGGLSEQERRAIRRRRRRLRVRLKGTSTTRAVDPVVALRSLGQVAQPSRVCLAPPPPGPPHPVQLGQPDSSRAVVSVDDRQPALAERVDERVCSPQSAADACSQLSDGEPGLTTGEQRQRSALRAPESSTHD